MTNTEQIAAMAERIEKLEKALREVAIKNEYGGVKRCHLCWRSWQQKERHSHLCLLSSGDQG